MISPFAERRAGLADLGGLRERADGRGRERGEVEALRLRGVARGEVARAVVVRVGDRGDRVAHRLHVGPGVLRARLACRPGGGEGVGDGPLALRARRRERHDLLDLLVGERQPRQDLPEVVLARERVRHVEQRRGRRDRDRPAEHLARGRLGERRVEVRAPDVVAVDDARDRRDGAEVDPHGDGAADEVETDGLDPGGDEHGKRVVERRVRRGDEDRRTVGRAGELVVRLLGRLENLRPGRVEVGDERGLVDLHPCGARVLERREELAVDGQQIEQAGERVELRRRLVALLGEQEERDGPGDDRPREVARLLGLDELVHPARRAQGEDRLGADLRHQVVVVRVEPLGHLEGGVVALAARDGAVARQVDRPVVAPHAFEALGNRADGDRGVEHVVVEREVRRDGGVVAAQPERGHALEVREAQLAGGGLEVVGGRRALPEGLERLLQLAVRADARVAEDGAAGEGGGRGRLGAHLLSSNDRGVRGGLACARGARTARGSTGVYRHDRRAAKPRRRGNGRKRRPVDAAYDGP